MTKLDESRYKLPAAISYPRCGRHFLVACLERYFRRPCNIVINQVLTHEERQRPILFWHFHDERSSPVWPAKRVLYLMRDPVDVIHSRFMADPAIEDATPERGWVMLQAALYKAHLEKYLDRSDEVLRYERLVDDFDSEFAKACAFFGEKSLDPARLADVKSATGKKDLLNNTPWMSPAILTEEYKASRERFRERWAEDIYRIIKETDQC